MNLFSGVTITMNNYVATKYGMVCADTPRGMMDTIVTLLRSHIRNCHDGEMLYSGELLKDLGPSYKAIIGKSFKAFLKANYDNGIGRRAGTVRNIVLYLNGEISGRSLSSKIQADERNCNTFISAPESSQNILPNRVEMEDKLLDKMNKLDDSKAFYVLMEGIGPDLTSRLLLTFLGVNS